jgi:hypothetical protein
MLEQSTSILIGMAERERQSPRGCHFDIRRQKIDREFALDNPPDDFRA